MSPNALLHHTQNDPTAPGVEWQGSGKADLVSILGGESARLLELDLGDQAGLQVGDTHDARVLNVHLPHDQVVDGRIHLQTGTHMSPAWNIHTTS